MVERPPARWRAIAVNGLEMSARLGIDAGAFAKPPLTNAVALFTVVLLARHRLLSAAAQLEESAIGTRSPLPL
jgi:hypothetical protein